MGTYMADPPNQRQTVSTGHSREMVVYTVRTSCGRYLRNLKPLLVMNRMFLLVVKSGTHISLNVLNDSSKDSIGLRIDLPPFTVHDFRRTASTHLNEQGFNSDAIEACLNHTAKGVRGVYNKAIV